MTINKYCFGLLPLCLSLTSWANTNGLTNIPLPNTTPTHRYYVEAHAAALYNNGILTTLFKQWRIIPPRLIALLKHPHTAR